MINSWLFNCLKLTFVSTCPYKVIFQNSGPQPTDKLVNYLEESKVVSSSISAFTKMKFIYGNLKTSLRECNFIINNNNQKLNIIKLRSKNFIPYFISLQLQFAITVRAYWPIYPFIFCIFLVVNPASLLSYSEGLVTHNDILKICRIIQYSKNNFKYNMVKNSFKIYKKITFLPKIIISV